MMPQKKLEPELEPGDVHPACHMHEFVDCRKEGGEVAACNKKARNKCFEDRKFHGMAKLSKEAHELGWQGTSQ